MPKNLFNKVVSKENISNTCINMTAILLAGKVASTISNAFFHFDLNRYNSIDHLVMGVGVGTLAYRKAGGGLKGVVSGAIAASVFNAAWESFENFYVFKNYKLDLDTILDVAVVYGGSALGFLTENAKDYVNRNKIKREKKWLL